MPDIWTMGEILVEIMRPRAGMYLDEPGEFLGPYPSGAPAIFIDTAARLGRTAGIIGGVGEDDFGRCVLERLDRDGVDTSLVRRVAGEATATAFVTYFEDGSRKFIFHLDHTAAITADPSGVGEIPLARYFHVMGCSLMAGDALRAGIFLTAALLRGKGAKISFDPNIREELLGGRDLDQIVGPILKSCSILLPGEKELALLAGEKEPGRAAEALLRRYESLETIALKRGARGCSIYTKDTVLDLPAYRVDEVDPTGAGDCFDAAFLCGMLEGRTLEMCGRMAAAVGALNVAAFGPMEGKISRRAVQDLIDGRETLADGKR